MEEKTLQLDKGALRRMLGWARQAFAIDSPWPGDGATDDEWDDWELEVL